MKRPPHRVNRDFRLPVLLCRFSQRRWLCWSLLALGMIVSRLALLPLVPIPEPEVHDEFSYLLAADTFAHGRLVNPALPQPASFESPHVLVTPIYASKYQPGQGLLLAFGQRFVGHPYWGVVLAGALMIFLFCWAADAWLPPQWTLIAGALACVLFSVRHYWFNSYWGGALAACDGALIVGGLGRLLTARRAGISLGLGAILFYVTRPYEGGVLCLAVLAILAVHLWGSTDRAAILRRVILPNAAIVLAAVPLALAYNIGTTGKATDLPYLMHQRQYDSVPVLWILPPLAERQYETRTSAGTWAWAKDSYETVRSLPFPKAAALQVTFIALAAVGQQFLGFSLLLLAAPWARVRGRKWLLLLLAAGASALFIEVWVQAHYAAPFTAALLIVIVAAARAVWYRAASVRWGPAALMPLMVLLFAPVVVSYVGALQPEPTERGKVLAQLGSQGGRHIVFVEYDPQWDFLEEWVYNGADLDASPVIFAHLRPSAENQKVIERYAGRTAWHVRLGPKPHDVRLKPYFSATVTTYSPSENGLSK